MGEVGERDNRVKMLVGKDGGDGTTEIIFLLKTYMLVFCGSQQAHITVIIVCLW